jgi:farnesyl-diphosphate farnesyltransferase
MTAAATVEHASGKGANDENFPVGSQLIARKYRPHVMAYYRFARNADDVADSAELSAEEKIRRLDRMAAVLDGAPGEDAPAAASMRLSLQATGIDPAHCHELLAAFRQDAVKLRYDSWQELMDYCRLSAMPVGRFLLDLHGESRACWPASDALCAALQVINHLQDCARDHAELDRVYLPADWLAEAGGRIEDLTGSAATPGLRSCLDRCIAATWELVHLARTLPGGVKDFGLRAESAVIVDLAARLQDKLSRQDPLAMRVKLGGFDLTLAALSGVGRALIGGGP